MARQLDEATMSLIELLGGCGEARKFEAVLSEKLTEKQKNNVVFMDAFNELNNELLEYRRANHIFEVGDRFDDTGSDLDIKPL